MIIRCRRVQGSACRGSRLVVVQGSRCSVKAVEGLCKRSTKGVCGLRDFVSYLPSGSRPFGLDL